MTSHAVLSSQDHRDLRVRTDHGPDQGDAVQTALIVPAEFRQVQNDYVILFRLAPERDSYSALALFGFEAGENLYLDGDRWDAPHRPLAIDIQPFLIGQPGPEAADDDRQVHVDLASPRLITGGGAGEGTRVFDADGRPTPYLESVAEKLGLLHSGYRDAPDFFAALRRHELLEPLTIEVTLDDGSTNRLVGYHVIDEDRLPALDAAALAELHEEGHLMPIFMALASLANLSKLIARKNRRTAGG